MTFQTGGQLHLGLAVGQEQGEGGGVHRRGVPAAEPTFAIGRLGDAQPT